MMSVLPINTDSTGPYSLRVNITIRRYPSLPKPNGKIPAPMELDINPNDGYVLSDYGELFSYDDPISSAPPPPTTEGDEQPRQSAKFKRPRPPCRQKKVMLDVISPTCSGFRFPDLPSTPTSPESAKRDFQALVDRIKERDLTRAQSLDASVSADSPSPPAAARISLSISTPKLSPAPRRKPASPPVDMQTKVLYDSKKKLSTLSRTSTSSILRSSSFTTLPVSMLNRSLPNIPSTPRRSNARTAAHARAKSCIISRARISPLKGLSDISPTPKSVMAF